jgi:hypothetical protein
MRTIQNDKVMHGFNLKYSLPSPYVVVSYLWDKPFFPTKANLNGRNGRKQVRIDGQLLYISFDSSKLRNATLKVSLDLTDICRTKWKLHTQWWDGHWHMVNLNSVMGFTVIVRNELHYFLFKDEVSVCLFVLNISQVRLYHSSGGLSPASHCSSLGFIPAQAVWTEWYSASCSPSTSVSPANFHSTNCSAFINVVSVLAVWLNNQSKKIENK